ncbi:MAG: hypothetical protein PHT32_07555, partial [Candidatus Omnitrophica bacterium]|nr:hypothetical protein [Candidatus Omnitrophota bacterium]
MFKKVLVLVLLGLIVIPQFVNAEETKPIQLAVFDPVQMVPADESIRGLRLSLFYTVNKNVSGLSLVWLGVNRATGDVSGVELGLGNWVEGAAYGGQLGIVNHAGKRFVGVQYGMANVTEGDLTGLQWGLVNWTEGYMHGVQAGLLNVSKGQSIGGELGIVNYNDGSFKGFQGGFVNYAKEMHGFQLGIV